MHWVIQQDALGQTTLAGVVAALQKHGISYSVHKVIPHIGKLTEPRYHRKGQNVICMGMHSMRHTAARYKWTPGVFDLTPFDFTVQLKRWGQFMLNADSQVVMFKDAVFTDELMFIRPIHDSKTFPGQVMSREDFIVWQHKVVDLKQDFGDGLQGTTLIQVCLPKWIEAEYRIWVVRGKIITASLYRENGRLRYKTITDDPALDFAKQRILDWQPHEAFVIDIAKIDEHEYKVIELNTLNPAGLYAADVEKLVLTLDNTFTLGENNETIRPPSTSSLSNSMESARRRSAAQARVRLQNRNR